MLVLHANWTRRRLRLWAETDVAPDGSVDAAAAIHPFALSARDLAAALEWLEPPPGIFDEPDVMPLRLPAVDGRPEPSPLLRGTLPGVDLDSDAVGSTEDGEEDPETEFDLAGDLEVLTLDEPGDGGTNGTAGPVPTEAAGLA